MEDEFDLGLLRRTKRGADRFVELIESVERGSVLTVSKDGTPVAVIIGIEDYEHLRSALSMHDAQT